MDFPKIICIKNCNIKHFNGIYLNQSEGNFGNYQKFDNENNVEIYIDTYIYDNSSEELHINYYPTEYSYYDYHDGTYQNKKFI